MGRSCLVALVVAGCGAAPPHTLASLPNKQVSLIVDFNPPTATPPIPAPEAVAFLQFDNFASSCPTVDVTAALDGVALTASPALSGSTGDACLLTFGLAPAPSAAAAQSTLRFADDQGGSATFTAARLLDPRALATTLTAGTVVHAGDALAFRWPVDSDVISSVGATFLGGTAQQAGTTSFAGTGVMVIVPSLAPGSWTLRVDVIANPAPVACSGAAQCGGMVRAKALLDLTVG